METTQSANNNDSVILLTSLDGQNTFFVCSLFFFFFPKRPKKISQENCITHGKRVAAYSPEKTVYLCLPHMYMPVVAAAGKVPTSC